MIALTKSVAVSAMANAGSLAVAAWVFPNFEVQYIGFIIAVVLFTLFSVALKEFIGSTVDRFVRGYTVAGGLALTAVALMLTDLLVPEHGFAIEGWGTRAGVTAIVWAAGIAYGEVDTKAPEPRKAA
jgi:hypothetical protein